MAVIKVSETRAERREARYKHLRLEGFSAKDARRYRDRSATSIRALEDDTRKEITALPPKKRDDFQRNILRGIRNSRRRENKIDTEPRLKPKSERQREFSEWTGDRNFPQWADIFIAEQNEEKGLDHFNSYGYRRFWHHYVDGIPMEDIGDLADRGDSNIESAN